VGSAVAELGVERVEDLTADATNREVPEKGEDVRADEAFVACARGDLDVDDLEVALQQLADRGRRPRLPVSVEVGEQPRPDLLGLRPSLRTVWDGLGQVVPLLGDRVDTRVDADLESPAGQHDDLAAPSTRRLLGGHRPKLVVLPISSSVCRGSRRWGR